MTSMMAAACAVGGCARSAEAQRVAAMPRTPNAGSPHHGLPDSPLGRTITVPSGVTGKPLSYFTPDPLPDLLARYLPEGSFAPSVDSPYSPLLLLRVAARSNDGQIDLAQVNRFVSIMLGHQGHRVDDLVDLGCSLSPKVTGVRNEIVFVGRLIASSARHIYAPHAELPRLLQSIECGLEALKQRPTDPVVASAIVAMFCAYVHPFIDANGRWLRLIAFSAGRCAGVQSGWMSMAVVAFLNPQKQLLSNAIWPNAKANGAAAYLAAVAAYVQRLRVSLQAIDAFKVIQSLTNAVLTEPRMSRRDLHLIAGAVTTGRLSIDSVRSVLGLSQRAATARLEAAATHLHSGVFYGCELDLSSFVKQLDSTAQAVTSEIY